MNLAIILSTINNHETSPKPDDKLQRDFHKRDIERWNIEAKNTERMG